MRLYHLGPRISVALDWNSRSPFIKGYDSDIWNIYVVVLK